MKGLAYWFVFLWAVIFTACHKPANSRRLQADVRTLTIVDREYSKLSDTTRGIITESIETNRAIIPLKITSQDEFKIYYSANPVHQGWFNQQFTLQNYNTHFLVSFVESILGNGSPEMRKLKIFEHKVENKLIIQYKLAGYGDSYLKSSSIFFFWIPKDYKNFEIEIDRL